MVARSSQYVVNIHPVLVQGLMFLARRRGFEHDLLAFLAQPRQKNYTCQQMIPFNSEQRTLIAIKARLRGLY